MADSKLTLIRETKGPGGHALVECQCECGKITTIRKSHFVHNEFMEYINRIRGGTDGR